MGRVLWSQYLDRVWIKGQHHWSAIFGMGMAGRCGDHRLMTEMHSVKDTDCKKNRAGELSQLSDGMKNFHFF
jgi:hypothetical protein